MPAYKFAGQFTFEEYLSFQKKTASRRHMIAKCILWVNVFWLFLMGVLQAFPEINEVLFVMSFVFVVYAAFIFDLIFKIRIKRHWNKYPMAHEKFEVVLQDDGVEIMDDKGHPAHTNWSKIIKFDEIKSLFLLYLSPTLAIPLPKCLLTLDELQGCREFIKDKIHISSTMPNGG